MPCIRANTKVCVNDFQEKVIAGDINDGFENDVEHLSCQDSAGKPNQRVALCVICRGRLRANRGVVNGTVTTKDRAVEPWRAEEW
jgi:hypothetical protein